MMVIVMVGELDNVMADPRAALKGMNLVDPKVA